MTLLRALFACTLFVSASPAIAAPVPTSIVVKISIEDVFFAGTAITFTGAGVVSVTGSTVSIGAGTASLPAPVVVPVTATTAVSSITAMTLSNEAGTFSVGGVTVQAPGETCAGAPGLGVACNAGGGVGGIMGLNGFINVTVLPSFPFPLSLSAVRIGQGGVASVPFDADAAAWSTRTGSVGTALGTLALAGSGSPLRLVTPSYVDALGTELPIFATFTFTNVSLPVPEPGLSAVLLGALGLGWVWLARR